MIEGVYSNKKKYFSLNYKKIEEKNIIVIKKNILLKYTYRNFEK